MTIYFRKNSYQLRAFNYFHKNLHLIRLIGFWIRPWSTRLTVTPRVFHVETTWKHSFPCRFNVKYTWSVCRLFYKQRQAETCKKNKQKLSNTLRLNFWQACPENKFFCVNEIIWLIVMKMKMIIKNQIKQIRHK